jgi:hypothetical protein
LGAALSRHFATLRKVDQPAHARRSRDGFGSERFRLMEAPRQ